MAQKKNTIDRILIEKGFDMRSKVDLIPVIVPISLKNFNDFGTGQGYVDTMGDVRFKIDSEYYIHINGDFVDLNEKTNWSLLDKVQVRTFELIVKEV